MNKTVSASKVSNFYIVGINKVNNGSKAAMNVYSVLRAEYNANAKYINDFGWKFQIAQIPENNMKVILNEVGNNLESAAFKNFKFDKNGKVVASPASFDRFKTLPNGLGTALILSSIKKENGDTIGYKVASIQGNGTSFKVSNVTEKNLVAFCTRYLLAKKANKIEAGAPIQNAIYRVNKDTNKGYIASYPNYDMVAEVYKVSKNKFSHAEKAEVTAKAKEVEKVANGADSKKSKIEALKEIYSDDQIKELLSGSKKGLKIKLYANPKLTAEQMAELRKGLEAGVDISYIALPEYKTECMKSYILDLKDGIDIKEYLNPKYTKEQLAELSLAADMGLDISKMGNPKFSATELSEIRERLQLGVFKEYKVSSREMTVGTKTGTKPTGRTKRAKATK